MAVRVGRRGCENNRRLAKGLSTTNLLLAVRCIAAIASTASSAYLHLHRPHHAHNPLQSCPTMRLQSVRILPEIVGCLVDSGPAQTTWPKFGERRTYTRCRKQTA